jgi:hypothetical protein
MQIEFAIVALRLLAAVLAIAVLWPLAFQPSQWRLVALQHKISGGSVNPSQIGQRHMRGTSECSACWDFASVFASPIGRLLVQTWLTK